MKLDALKVAVDAARAALPAKTQATKRANAVTVALKGNARKGGPVAGKAKIVRPPGHLGQAKVG